MHSGDLGKEVFSSSGIFLECLKANSNFVELKYQLLK